MLLDVHGFGVAQLIKVTKSTGPTNYQHTRSTVSETSQVIADALKKVPIRNAAILRTGVGARGNLLKNCVYAHPKTTIGKCVKTNSGRVATFHDSPRVRFSKNMYFPLSSLMLSPQRSEKTRHWKINIQTHKTVLSNLSNRRKVLRYL